MSEAREEILRRIAAALADVPSGERAQDVPVARDYRQAGGARQDGGAERRDEVIDLFAERVADYRAEVRVVAAGEVGAAVTAACREWGLAHVAVPTGLRTEWRPDGVTVTEDSDPAHPLTAHELDALDGAVTGCAAAIAETGTLVLEGDGDSASGRRLLTLVPDHHVCIVTAEQIAPGVPDAIAAVEPAAVQRGVPITLVSGPSASSDIELARVEGVHGPRHLRVIIARD